MATLNVTTNIIHDDFETILSQLEQATRSAFSWKKQTSCSFDDCFEIVEVAA